MKYLTFLSLSVVASLGSATAHSAEPRDAAAGDVLFHRAKDALAAGDVAAACAGFAESQRLDPAAGTLLNLADCEERQGKLASAWQHFTEGREHLPDADFRISFAEGRIQSLARKVPRLTLTLATPAPAAQVFRDQFELGAASLGVALPIDPGTHVIVVRAAGRSEARIQIEIAAGEQRSVGLEPGPATLEGVTQHDGAPIPSSPHDGSRRTMGYVIGGAGVLGLALGTVTGLMTLSAASRVKASCRPEGCAADGTDAAATGKVVQVVSPVALGVGAVGAAVGAWLIFSTPRRAVTGTVVAPFVATGGGGLAVARSF